MEQAVTAYALELVETLDNWDKQPESVAELRKMMLNGRKSVVSPRPDDAGILHYVAHRVVPFV